MQLADSLSLVLVDNAARLRAQYPGLFLVVDATKARPGWKAFRQHDQTQASRECAWCGDDFPVAGTRSAYCSQRCRRDFTFWRHPRRRECAWCGDPFIAASTTAGTGRCCSIPCDAEYRKWYNRRTRAAA